MSKNMDEKQSARFIEAARELGANEDEATFKAKLGVIARQKGKPEEAEERPSEGGET